MVVGKQEVSKTRESHFPLPGGAIQIHRMLMSSKHASTFTPRR